MDKKETKDDLSFLIMPVIVLAVILVIVFPDILDVLLGGLIVSFSKLVSFCDRVATEYLNVRKNMMEQEEFSTSEHTPKE